MRGKEGEWRGRATEGNVGPHEESTVIHMHENCIVKSIILYANKNAVFYVSFTTDFDCFEIQLDDFGIFIFIHSLS